MYLQPLNRRDLLIYSDAGGAWLYRQLDLPLDNPANEILPAGQVRVKFPHSKALVQVQQPVFLSTCKYTTPVIDLGWAPKDNGADIGVDVFYDGQQPVSWRLLTASGTEVCSSTNPHGQPDGTATAFKFEVTLNSRTHLYAIGVTFAGKREQRTGAGVALTGRELIINRGDGSGPRATYVVDPPATEPRDNGWPLGLRPGTSIGVYDAEGRETFVGLAAPKLVGSQAPAAALNVESLTVTLRHALFRAATRFDGMYVGAAVLKCLRLAGLTDMTSANFEGDVAEDDRVKVYKGDLILGDPRGKVTCWRVNAQESAEEVLKRILPIWSTYDLGMREVGGRQKVYFGPKYEGTTVVKTFWRSHLKAGWDNCYWSDVEITRRRRTEDGTPWNGVLVRGRDPDGPYLYARYDAPESVTDPSLPETERPRDWYGAPLVKSYYDDHLVTQDAVNYVKDVLKWRYVDTVEYASWTAEFDPKLHPGDLVELEGYGRYHIVSMTAIAGKTMKELDIASCEYRPTRYVGEAAD